MIALTVTIDKYLKDVNYFECTLSTGEKAFLDHLSDQEYNKGKGFECVGKTYLLTDFHIGVLNGEKSMITPTDNGIIEFAGR